VQHELDELMAADAGAIEAAAIPDEVTPTSPDARSRRSRRAKAPRP